MPIRIIALLCCLMIFSCKSADSQDKVSEHEKLQLAKKKASAEAALIARKHHKETLRKQQAWADSIYAKLSIKERIGQLFMVAAYSNQNEDAYKKIDHLIKEYHIGGLIFFQGGPVRQAVLTNRYQAKSKIPLLIGQDAEWGLGMRLDSTISYPYQMTLGAVGDNTLIYRMGKEIGRQCKRLGVHINFAPVIDVNSNPENPVIGVRSFGEDKDNVAAKGSAYMQGLQDMGIIATAKHFPGHGDTDSDSHHTLPLLSHDKARMDEIELYPFSKLFKDSVAGVMVAHLNIPAFAEKKNMPTTLSRKVVTDILRDSLGFKGLAFTDAMNMKGLADNSTAGEAEVLALEAGNDILLYPISVSKGVEAIEKALKSGRIPESEFEVHIKRILKGKYFAGLHEYKPVKLKGLYEDLNSPDAKIMNERLHEQAVTIVRNNCGVLPFVRTDSTSFASLNIGARAENDFQSMLSNYAPFEHHSVPDKNSAWSVYEQKLKALKEKDIVVIGLFGVNQRSLTKNFGISSNTKKFIKELEKHTTVILTIFGVAYSLRDFAETSCLVAAYTENEMMQRAVPQVLFAAVKADAKLPVSASEKLPAGTGHKIASVGRLRHSTVPERAGFDGKVLRNKIDWLINNAITRGATPGGQVLVARNNIVIMNEGYGHYTYKKKMPVTEHTIYDLASLTKVTATGPTFMHIVENTSASLNDTVGYFMPETRDFGKGALSIRNLLAHSSGLYSYMPSWKRALQSGDEKTLPHSDDSSGEFTVEILDKLYAASNIEKNLWEWALNAPLRPKYGNRFPERYSDVGFFFLKKLSERITGVPLEDFVMKNFYAPLGLSTMGYKPLERFPKYLIAPTEREEAFRNKLLQGEVHDYSAALMGGVGGNAGVFSNAHDVAVMMQMFLNGGTYAGKRYFKEETLNAFNTKQNEPYGRRALAWDKPVKGERIPVTHHASASTYGHTGYTGGCVWTDPEEDLIFIFLCNRVYPRAENKLLIKKGYRTRMHDAVYQSLQSFEKKKKD